MMFKNIKIFICMTLLTLMSGGSYAQDTSLLDKVYDKMSSSCIDMSYSYTVSVSGTKNHGDGVIALQDRMWKLKGNGLEMYCDASTLWVVDPSAKEVMIEPAASSEEIDAFTNPAVIFSDLQKLFEVRSSVPSDDGRERIFILKPKSALEVEYVNVSISKDSAEIKGIEVALSDGSLIKIKVSSMEPTPLCPIAYFRPEMKFDSSWIVTDMR